MFPRFSNIVRSTSTNLIFGSFFSISVFLALLYTIFDPRFETNDDVAMSMVAHGYGDAAYGSPFLIYSNVLWGYIVSATPTIRDVLGYSVATVLTLLVAACAIAYFLIKLGAAPIVAVLAVCAVLARPALFAQFTINAGLIAVAAVFGAIVYARRGGIGILICSCLLVFLAFLIRLPECVLVLAVATPLIPWHVIRKRPEALVAASLLLIAIFAAMYLDAISYNGPEWKRYIDARGPLTEIAAWSKGEIIKLQPELLSRHGYSVNDIKLIENAFWGDVEISNPTKLNALLADSVGAQPEVDIYHKALQGLQIIGSRDLLPLLLIAFVLLLNNPRWPLFISWLLFLLAIVAIAILGRSGITRIYVPLASLLLLAPLAFESNNQRKWPIYITLCSGWIFGAYLLIPDANKSTQLISEYQKDLHGVPNPVVINWANSVHHEFSYPLLARDLKIRELKLYDISAFSFAPFSVSYAEQLEGRDFRSIFKDSDGISLILPYSFQYELLDIYCRERIGGEIKAEYTYKSYWIYVQNIKCM